MGIWEFMGSAAETVKRNAPDTTPLKDACRSSYAYGSAAAGQIDQAVRLGEWLPDGETRSKICLYSTKFAQNAGTYAFQEGFKLVPGGAAFSDIVTKTLKDVEQENLKVEKLKMSEDETGTPQKIYSGGPELIYGPETRGRGGGEAVSDDIGVMPAVDKNPEDLIRVFMMKEFFGNPFFDDLMVHELARGKGKQHE
ncbi:hypothetical protein PHJA_000001100 [Phtheirospermum japonicum]|uniref:Uncharacterized protein n=1 Tax=Phtheirospermum japonicum TaxID=374723 RepID=A0A830AXA0_9LAMI|nr:hypothetical protein PHJA_000001100 [Phtheirospermum japonicum]